MDHLSGLYPFVMTISDEHWWWAGFGNRISLGLEPELGPATAIMLVDD